MKNVSVICSASLAALLLGSCQKEEPINPNILFILVDDMQSDAIASLVGWIKILDIYKWESCTYRWFLVI